MPSTPFENSTSSGLATADSDPVAKILAVDDDAANLLAFEAMLTDLGQPVICARSGEEALRYLLKDDFAVILLDVVMPSMDGYETATIIRGRERTRHVPIIFLSAMNKDTSQLARGYTIGAVDFVFKPIDPLILRSKVAVFVELQKRAQEIRRQAVLEKRLMADNLLVRDEQRRTEQALQRSLVQQSLVIDALPVMLYVASATDGFRSRRFLGGQLNSLFRVCMDASIDPLGWLNRIHPEDRPRVLQSIAESPDSSFSAEYRLRCEGGQYRWFSDRATLNRENPQEQFGILLDISDRRLLEEQLVHAQKMEAIGQMTGGVAHDFNNMLSVIIGSLDRVLSKSGGDVKTRSRLDLALQAARSCADLTNRLLGFARRQALNPKRLDLTKELMRLRAMVSRLVGKGIRLQIACGKNLWPVYVDASQLEAAIINLVINARDAMRNGGLLRISARNCGCKDPAILRMELQSGDYIELKIADSGLGMPPEVKARVFEPFFTTKEAGKGTGLGLSTVYGFVRQSGGSVAIDSEVGTGSTVRVYLPKAPSKTRSEEARAHPELAGNNLAGCRVMVVEDEAPVREMARSMLEEMGCHVTVAENGEAALRRLQSQGEFSLLFTDCMMPGGLDGVALATEVRRRTPDLPVLFSSGVRGRIEELGGDNRKIGFLPKPYTAEQLSHAIGALLVRSPS